MFQRRGGLGTFAETPERTKPVERKGGQHSGSNSKNGRERAVEAERAGGKIIRRPVAEKAAQ